MRSQPCQLMPALPPHHHPHWVQLDPQLQPQLLVDFPKPLAVSQEPEQVLVSAPASPEPSVRLAASPKQVKPGNEAAPAPVSLVPWVRLAASAKQVKPWVMAVHKAVEVDLATFPLAAPAPVSLEPWVHPPAVSC